MEDNKDPYVKHYAQLHRHTCIGIATDDDGFYGLIMVGPDGTERVAWISMDEEGNAPGFLSIQVVDRE